MLTKLNMKQLSLEAEYAAFEQTILCKNGNIPDHAQLPHFNGNKTQPIHRWFTYKEGFSSGLLPWICQTLNTRLEDFDAILDPFCGVGTSLLSAQMEYQDNKGNLNLVGVERNPFVAFVARTKLAWVSYRINRIRSFIPKLVDAIRRRPQVEFELPNLSTIQNQESFNRKKLNDLLYARQIIQDKLGSDPESYFFLLGWASIIEEVSNLRKDGRALRFVDKEDRPPVYRLLEEKWNSMLSDLVETEQKLKSNDQNRVSWQIHNSDGRTLQCIDNNDLKYDLILYSPPYLNNLDYSEVYKLELWLSGFVTTSTQFKELRQSTFRSHPSIKFQETDFVDNLLSNSWPKRLRDLLLFAIPKDEFHGARVRTVRAYMDDMFLALSKQFQLVKPGGHVVCVVGNSLHGNAHQPILVATDLLISALGQHVGFNIERLQIARQLRRRDHKKELNSHLLRESIIIMKRPLE